MATTTDATTPDITPDPAPEATPLRPLSAWWLALGYALPFVLSTVAAVLFSVGFLLSYTGPDGGEEFAQAFTAAAMNPLALVTVSMLPMWLGMLAVPTILSWGKRSWRQLTSWGWRPVDVLLGLGAGIAVTVITQVLGWGLEVLGVDAAQADNTGPLDQPTMLGVVLVAVAVCVVAPLVEEIFFRGFALNLLLGKMRPWLAVVISSALFGLVHVLGVMSLQGALILAVITGVVGAGLAVVRLRTGRLGASIVGHMVFNTVATVAVLLGS